MGWGSRRERGRRKEGEEKEEGEMEGDKRVVVRIWEREEIRSQAADKSPLLLCVF